LSALEGKFQHIQTVSIQGRLFQQFKTLLMMWPPPASAPNFFAFG
jgi:hypothetical protein